MTLADDLLLARQLARVADATALDGRERGYAVHIKPDGSAVTDVDLAVEEQLVALLRRERPDDRILSEECGAVGGDGERRWLLDPIDGTTDFIEARRSWGTHVALEDADGLLAAVVSRPTERAVWWAVRGGGSFVSTDRGDARLCVSSRQEPGELRAVGHLLDGSIIPALLDEAGIVWGGDDVYALGTVLDGRAEVFVEEGGHPWDRAPGALLVREAGGSQFVADGEDGSLSTPVWWLTNGLADPVLAAATSGRRNRPG